MAAPHTQGPPGSQGPPGPQGLAASSLFARVDNAGVLHQQSGGVKVAPQILNGSPIPGYWFVDFPRDVSKCAVVISQGEASNNGYVPSAQFLANMDSDSNNGSNPNRVRVATFTDNGTPISAGFDLIIAC